MARFTLQKLFRQMAFKPNKKGRLREFKLLMEEVEDRVVPATLPQPTLVTPTYTTASVAAAGFFNPQVVASPTNVQNQALVAMSATGIVAQTSTDGGQTWIPVLNFPATLPTDPSTGGTYAQTSSPSVAFGRDGTLYFVYLAHNATKSSGTVLFQKATFGVIAFAGASEPLYQWNGNDPALNPVIGVDNNLPTDPTTGIADTMIRPGTLKSKGVYIAWNGNATAVGNGTPEGGLNLNANAIMGVVSADDGATWSFPAPISDSGFAGGTGGAAPQIIFSPANSGSPGSMIYVWPTIGGAIRYDSTRPDNGVASNIIPQAFSTGLIGTTGAFADATVPPSSPPPPPNTPDSPNPQTYTLSVPGGTVSAAGSPAFALRDMSLQLKLTSPHLEHLRVTISRSGGGGTVTLFTNRIDGLGATRTDGSGVALGLPTSTAPTTGIGRLSTGSGIVGAVFDDQAARAINDNNISTTGYIGMFRPEDGTSLLAGLGLTNATAATINGLTFTLTVTDFKNDGSTVPTQSVDSWGLTFSSVTPGLGTDGASGLTGISIGADPTLTGSPLKPAISPTVGVAGSVSVSFDNTLGGASGGQMYLAFTQQDGSTSASSSGNTFNTDVYVSRATIGTGTLNFGAAVKVNDDRLGDNYTEGNRAQFTPAVTVDNITGTVVATWYDARLDANNTRAATFVATSLDGGASWSNQTYKPVNTASTNNVVNLPFLNQPKNAVDVITNTNYTLQPVPTNIPQAGARGVGIRQSVIASAGHIYAYWGGNSNAAGTNVMSAHAVTAVGPRVVSGTMGSVASLSSFSVTFDRPIDAATVTPASVELRYQNPYEPIGTFTTIPITGVSGGPTTFNFSFATQTAVGTYSYVVKPAGIKDLVTRLIGGVALRGNLMDQNSNATSVEAVADTFAIPTPVNGVPFTAPYTSSTLPFIIAGPQMSGSSVFGYNNSLVLGNNAAVNVDVFFNQPMNTNPLNGPVFGPSNIIRMTGPAGVVFDRATAASNPMTVTAISSTQFRIGFPTQVLSGTYTVEVDPLIIGATDLPGSTLLSPRYAYLDSNRNAGLDVLRGTASPTNGAPSNSVYNATFNATTTPTSTVPAASGVVAGMKEYPISVPDSYVIALSAGHQIQVQVNINSTLPDNTSVVDLQGELVAPDGTTVRLFTNVGNPLRTPGTLWFSNTLFNDTGNTPIQNGFQPFDSGPYNPQFPLGNLAGMNSTGTWILRILNAGAQTPDLTGWSLSLPQIKPGTGLGEANADRFAVSFRIFNQDPTSALTQDVWTAVGPASSSGNTARMNAIAFDPSDPSGNTVYVGAASGGLWKTNNFLTQTGLGPTYVPMGDSAPAFGLNVVSIAVFPRNSDPQQSIIFALTGEGDTGTPGVGVLRSMDGGRTWNVLDSRNNSDSPTIGAGSLTSISAASRDRGLFGVKGYKIVVDPVAVNNADKDVIVYMATGSGVWRSTDTGRHWTRLKQGDATDIVLAEGSAAKIGNPNIQIVYAAFRGDGVYMANPAYVAASMVLMSGFPGGNGSFIQGDNPLQPRVTITPPSDTPNGGGKGRTLLASPALTNNAVQDLNYQGWLYALVITLDGNIDGLYITKDFGQNWTSIAMSEFLVYDPLTNAPTAGYGTNNYLMPDHSAFGSPPGTANPVPAQGDYDVGFAIDPNNPNVVYLGGMTQSAIGPNGGLVRVDITGLQDAQAVVAYDNSAVDGGTIQFVQNNGNVTIKPNVPFVSPGPGGTYSVSSRSGINRGYLNVLRNPDGPFNTSNVLFTNILNINNKGWGATYGGFGGAEVGTDIHRIVTWRDPVTGKTRLVVEDDQGIGSAVDDGSGNTISNIGSFTLPATNRNGNLQIIQFYSSTAHPGQLSAEIAGAMFYGEAQDDGFPISTEDILQTGGGALMDWTGGGGDGAWVITDQTGSGTVYDYRWPCCGGGGSNFFRVNGVSRTFGLLQSGDNPTQNQGQWKFIAGYKFAVNPIDGNGIMISNQTGRIFRTVDQGVTWSVVADPVVTDYTNVGSYAQALAYGSPDPIFPDQFNNFLYAGTSAGKIWVTFTGGSPWRDISAGLTGSIQQIVPDPTRGSRAAYAVTSNGVFFKADSATATAWVNITGNVFSQSKPVFGEANASPQNGVPAMLRSLTSLAVDWRYAIPVDPQNSALGSYPVLYVGGYGGVVRSLDRGATWQTYPVGTTYTYTDPATGIPNGASITTPAGGYLPSVEVTQLTLSQGNIDPSTGQPIQQTGGLNMLTAATYGRGTWVIRLGTADNDPAIALITPYQVVKQSGPRVIAVTNTSSTATQNTIRVQFAGPVLASTFTASIAAGDVQLKDANGNPFTINSVTAVGDTTGPFAPYKTAIPAGVSIGEYHDRFDIVVTRPGGYTPFPGGFAEITIGEKVYDYAGFGMNQDDDFYNGEFAIDPDNGGAAEDAYHGYIVLGATVATGNLHIDQPITTVAGDPTRVIVSALNPATGLPLASYTGTINLDATINGRRALLTTEPIVELATLSQAGNVVTATTLAPVSFVVGQRIAVNGVATAGYNGGLGGTPPVDVFTVLSISLDKKTFTYTNPNFANLPTDIAGGGTVVGPIVPVAANSPTSTPYYDSLSRFNQYTFTAGDAGTHVFAVFYIGGSGPPSQTLLSVTDTSGNYSPAQSYVSVNPNYATQFVVTGTSPIVAGDAHTYTVKAVDPYGNIDINYTGTVTITMDDIQGTSVPLTHTYTSLDAGIFDFTVTLRTAGIRTVTATDATNPVLTLTGSHAVLVVPATPSVITVSGFADPTVAGVAHDYTVSLFDPYGNLATNYLGTVTMSSNDPYPGTFSPASYAFTAVDAGTHVFTNGATLYTSTLFGAPKRIITVSDASLGISGAQTAIDVNPAAMSQFVVSGFASPTPAGTARSFTVRAADPYGNRVPTYTGKVSFASSDLQAVLPTPTPYTFTVGDAGQHAFTATLKTAGLQSITASDTVTSSLTGAQSNILITPLAASSVQVVGSPTTTTAGVPINYTVTLRDIYNNVATGFTGVMNFTTTDTAGTFSPANSYTFVSGDMGTKSFNNGATLRTTGTWNIRATSGALTGVQSGIVVNPAAASQVIVSGFTSPTVAGVAHDFNVTLRDPFNNIATGYLGTLNFATTDPIGTFSPTSYAFVSGDAGVRTFTNGATLRQTGTWQISATDGSISGAQTGIVVNPAAASYFDVFGFTTPTTAGVAHNFTVTARDAFANQATGYVGTATFGSSDIQAVFAPTSYAFVAGDVGSRTFTNGATLKTAGTQTITAADSANSLTGTHTPPITVNPAATSQFLTNFPTPVTAGVAQAFTVRAADAFGNTTPSYLGTATITSNDPQVASFTPASPITFGVSDNGVLNLSGFFKTVGSRSITVTQGAITGTQSGIVVTPAAGATASVTGITSPTTAGVARSFTVTILDAFGNTATGYTGTIAFSSSDIQATFTTPTYTFTGADAGVHTFTSFVTPKTAGPQTISVSDGVVMGTHSAFTVVAAAASRVDVSGFQTPITAGVADNFTVTLFDPFNNIATGFLGTISLTSNDPQAVFAPPSHAYVVGDAGQYIFTGTLKTAGTNRSITALSGSLSGSQTNITVNAAAMSQFITNFPTLVTAGTSQSFTVRAADPFGNTITGYLGTATLTSSDGIATFSPSNSVTFIAANNGVRTISGILRTAGSQSITTNDGTFSTTQSSITVIAAAASQVIVSGFPNTVAGVAQGFNVTLRDPFNNVATGYLGTVSFTSSDNQASFVPTTYTFTSGDAGTRNFTNARLRTAGTQSITAGDGSISGTQTNITVTPAATSQFITNFPTPVTAGVTQSYTLRAADAFGNTTPIYTGTVTLSSNDTQAVFSPTNIVTFTGGDLGSKSLTATLKTAGTLRSISAMDGTFNGTQSPIVVIAAAADHAVVTGVPTTTAGVSRNFTVSVRDAFENVATSYVGTMVFSSSDGQATFSPTSFPFTATEAGQRTFVNGVTLKTSGTQSITATDSFNSITGTQSNITVIAAAANQVIFTGFPSSTVAGVPHDVNVTLRDPFNNVATGYTGTVSFTSSDPQAAFLPTAYTFNGGDAGTHTFVGGATLKTAGIQSISVGDGTLSVTQSNIAVSAAAMSQFLTNFPSPVTAGTTQNFTVRASDLFGNTIVGYTGTANLTSNDLQATFSTTTVSFTASDSGSRSLTGALKTSGIRTITTADGTFSGTQSGIIVNSATATTIGVTGFTSPVTAGIAGDFTVTAKDPFGNVATGYAGTVLFTSNDSQAVFAPTGYTFVSGDAGTHTFQSGATLKTAGAIRTITATDSTNSLVGTQTNIVVNPAAASTLAVTGFPGTVQATVDQGFTVTARDPFGNVATGYTGSVGFTSNDTLGTFVPNPYTFTGGDAGVHAFVGNFSTPGIRTFSVTDSGNASINATVSNIVVTNADVASFTLAGAPTLAEGGTAFLLNIRALDRFGRLLTTYNGTVRFDSSDPYAELPASATLTNGVGSATFKLFTPRVRSIRVFDSVIAAAMGSTNINVHGGVMQPAIVTDVYAVGAGGGPGLNLYDSVGTQINPTYLPFGSTFTGGIRTATADFNLDGVADVVAGSGPGIVAQVKIIDGRTGATLFNVQPFSDFTGGVFVSAGTIVGDGFPDLLITPDQGGGPRVSVYHGGTFTKIADFFGIEDPNFRGGARAAAGDIDGDGTDDIVVSAGFSGGPRISVFDGAALINGQIVHPVGDFFAFDQSLRDGTYVALGDVNGDGMADFIFGAGPGGGPRTAVIDADTLLNTSPQNALANPIANFFTGDFTKRGGIREAIKNLDGDEFADLVVGDGEFVGSDVRVYLGKNLKDGGIGREYSFRAFPEVNAGVYVG